MCGDYIKELILGGHTWKVKQKGSKGFSIIPVGCHPSDLPRFQEKAREVISLYEEGKLKNYKIIPHRNMDVHVQGYKEVYDEILVLPTE